MCLWCGFVCFNQFSCTVTDYFLGSTCFKDIAFDHIKDSLTKCLLAVALRFCAIPRAKTKNCFSLCASRGSNLSQWQCHFLVMPHRDPHKAQLKSAGVTPLSILNSLPSMTPYRWVTGNMSLLLLCFMCRHCISRSWLILDYLLIVFIYLPRLILISPKGTGPAFRSQGFLWYFYII